MSIAPGNEVSQISLGSDWPIRHATIAVIPPIAIHRTDLWCVDHHRLNMPA